MIEIFLRGGRNEREVLVENTNAMMDHMIYKKIS
jgi:hypothetical protein